MPHGSHPNLFYQFKNGPFRASLFFFAAVIMFIIKFCWCLDTNDRPLESEATTLPTEPQPLPNLLIFVQVKNFGVFWPTFELLSTVSRRSTSGFDHFRRPPVRLRWTAAWSRKPISMKNCHFHFNYFVSVHFCSFNVEKYSYKMRREPYKMSKYIKEPPGTINNKSLSYDHHLIMKTYENDRLFVQYDLF